MSDSNKINENNDIQSTLVVFILQQLIKEDELKATLSTREIEVINLLLNNNIEILKQVNTHINNIIKDYTLDSNDIPDLILLISEVFNLYNTKLNKLKITRSDLIDFIRLLLVNMIKMNKVKVSDKEMYIKLINLSLKLLETKINVKKVIKCNIL
jgi:hypothetical protein